MTTPDKKEKTKDILPPEGVFELPVLPVKDVVLFPSVIVPLIVTDKDSIGLIDNILTGDKIFGHFTLKPDESAKTDDEAKAYDLYEHGVRAEVLRMLKFPDGGVRILVQGLQRIRLEGITKRKPYLVARVKSVKDKVERSKELDATMRNVSSLFIKMVKQIPYLPGEELQVAVMNVSSPGALAYLVAANLNLSVTEKQKFLEIDDVKEKLSRLDMLLSRELEILKIGSQIQSEVQDEITKVQREHVLREQLKAIQRQLGQGDERTAEVDELREQVKKAKVPPEAEKVCEDELNRLLRIPAASAEYTVVRNYLDWLINLPWSVSTTDNLDIKRAQTILDEDHYGLEKIKERVLEYLAVRKLKHDMKGPILCFAGPPGVGKTSLGKSIAHALGRKFFRMSLGGIRDEAEVRGHRRTYVGALPGRILQGIRKAGSNNPIFMLDEVDKIGTDFRGDPSSALLEVLDPEQNFSFSDHYLEVPFDLSKVMFITTANILDTIPPALQDRMEVLELPGYTEEEKMQIARRHLIPKQLDEHGLASDTFVINEKALEKIITNYTREAGVRNLERTIATICRKVAKNIASGKKVPKQVSEKNLEDFLGVIEYFSEVAERTNEPGVATGLAWTSVGGDILFIEATRMPGNKSFTLTGQLGDVMKESAQAALSYIRTHAKALKVSQEFFKNSDIHIHVPAGAIPKDGPSAGITMTVALVSLLTHRPIRSDVAMTGEITLRGKILPVGGIKEKILAARRAGIKTIILPKKNRKDLKEIPKRVIKGLKFELVENISQALRKAFAIRKV
ncbi:endopeptidase La [Planctomycetota bacterium]